jgi:hypothetical protein
MAEKPPNDYGSWREELERIKRHAEEGLCLDGDGSGMFFKEIGSFSDFILKDGRGKDPNIVVLFNLFRRFRPDLCSPGQLKKSQEEIVGLCIKICQKFKE